MEKMNNYEEKRKELRAKTMASLKEMREYEHK